MLEKLDEQLLPSLYASVASSFSATAQELGWITFGRALVQALASPLGGLAGQQWLEAKLTHKHWLPSHTMTIGLQQSGAKLPCPPLQPCNI